jgi:uncharacterized membrane protein
MPPYAPPITIPWPALGILAALFTFFVGTFWGMLRHYHRKSERAVEVAIGKLEVALTGLGDEIKQNQREMHRLEVEILKLRAELAKDYVRREEHTRAMERIYGKLDELGRGMARLAGGA